MSIPVRLEGEQSGTHHGGSGDIFSTRVLRTPYSITVHKTTSFLHGFTDLHSSDLLLFILGLSTVILGKQTPGLRLGTYLRTKKDTSAPQNGPCRYLTGDIVITWRCFTTDASLTLSDRRTGLQDA